MSGDYRVDYQPQNGPREIQRLSKAADFRGRPTPVDVRFWAKVIPAAWDECWEWAGYKTQGGYGRFTLRHGVLVMAHRWSYEEMRAEIPDGLGIDHLCRNRACVNPWHVEPVTPSENMKRIGTALGCCRNGHPRTPENTFIRPAPLQDGSPGIGCRVCRSESCKQRRTCPDCGTEVANGYLNRHRQLHSKSEDAA